MRLGIGIGITHPRFGGAVVLSASAVVTGATEITFEVLTSYAYAGIEWGPNPSLVWSKFDATQSTDHDIVLGAADGLGTGIYAWRPYATNDELDAPENRVYGTGGTVSVTAAIGLESSPDFLLQENGDRILMESGNSTDISAMSAAAALSGGELWAVVQGGATKYCTTDQLRTYING